MFLGLTAPGGMIVGGFVLLGVFLLLVHKYNLYRTDFWTVPKTDDGNKLPMLAAVLIGLAGGALVLLGMRLG
jgi:hypothetical protein